jgi:hypothetical protein
MIRLSRWQDVAVVGAILVVQACATLPAVRLSSTTYDELLHLTAGYSYWLRNDYRLQPENGNLPQRWSTLPLLFQRPAFPAADDPDWQATDMLNIGRRFFYELGNDVDGMLWSGRCMAVAWAALLTLAVFGWARQAFGSVGGWAAALCIAFWPAVLAHGALVTSDVCLAALFTLSLWAFWNALARVSPATVAACCLAVALSAIAKHSSVLLAPAFLLLAGCSIAARRPMIAMAAGRSWPLRTPGRQVACAAAVAGLSAAAAWAAIWISVGDRFLATADGSGPTTFFLGHTLESLAARSGGVGRVCRWLGEIRALPEAWLFGLLHVIVHAKARNAFACGLYSQTGWWWYFPLCFAVKNTIPALLLTLWAAIAAWRAGPAIRSALLPAGAVIVLLGVVFLTSRLNIGERHLMPMYPLICIGIGGLAASLRGMLPRIVCGAAIGLHVIAALAAHPHYIGYFNQFVPREHAHEWLIDSNLDWGQDLKRLAIWLRSQDPATPVYIATFGTGSPPHERISAIRLGDPDDASQVQTLGPGMYCVSATRLWAVSGDPAGPWCRKFEQAYDHLRGRVDSLAEDEIAVFNRLQAARMLAALRHRQPDERVAASILIYHLGPEDVDAALNGSPRELEDVSWLDREGGSRNNAAH